MTRQGFVIGFLAGGWLTMGMLLTLPMIAAAVLTDEPVVLQNVPLIRDVLTMLEILEDLGVAVARRCRG